MYLDNFSTTNYNISEVIEEMKCKNCGAEISYDRTTWGKKTRCSYCRTEYNIDLVGRVEEYKVKIEILGEIMDFYIGEIKVEPRYVETTRLDDTSIRAMVGKPSIRLELISM